MFTLSTVLGILFIVGAHVVAWLNPNWRDIPQPIRAFPEPKFDRPQPNGSKPTSEEP